MFQYLKVDIPNQQKRKQFKCQLSKKFSYLATENDVFLIYMNGYKLKIYCIYILMHFIIAIMLKKYYNLLGKCFL